MNNYIIIGIVLVMLLAVAVWTKNKQDPLSDGKSHSYKAKNLLTQNEMEFLSRLEEACPQYRFHAQVCMAAIMEPEVSRSNRSEYSRARGKIAQKMIDYVVQDKATGKIVALIELDDRTHDSDKDAARDELTSSAGYNTIRWESKKKPSVAEIRKMLVS